jgi:hypothetical protein
MKTLSEITQANENVKNVENQLFDVVMQPLIVADPIFQVSDTFGVFKSSGGGQLGVVGKSFNPTQPRAVFEAFCDAILEYGLDTATLKMTEVKNGEIVRFSVDLEPISYINIAKKEDTTIPTLNLQLGLNGKVKTSMYLSTLRLVCTNGAKKSFTEFQTSFKNVKGNEGKIVGMLNDVVNCVNEVKNVTELYQRMQNVKINDEIVKKYIDRVLGYDLDNLKEYSKIKQQNIELIRESIDLEIGRTGKTLFGLYNGFTHYANHQIKTKDTDNVFSGVGSKVIKTTENLILEMI